MYGDQSGEFGRRQGLISMLVVLKTFKFKDEDDYKYDIWLKVLLAYSENIDSPESFILPFLTRKVSTVTFSEGGYTLSWSQNDKTSNIW